MYADPEGRHAEELDAVLEREEARLDVELALDNELEAQEIAADLALGP